MSRIDEAVELLVAIKEEGGGFFFQPKGNATQLVSQSLQLDGTWWDQLTTIVLTQTQHTEVMEIYNANHL
jgi:hypothetical protein